MRLYPVQVKTINSFPYFYSRLVVILKISHIQSLFKERVYFPFPVADIQFRNMKANNHPSACDGRNKHLRAEELCFTKKNARRLD
jgi:hypothetical protein